MIYIAFSELYHHSLPPEHRFPMEKYTLIPEQLRYDGSFASENFFIPELMENGYISAVHDKEYIDKLNMGTLTYKEQRRIGFPYSKTLIQREEHICAGTTQAALKALDHGVAFNVAGGTHHAYRGHGEGYCMYNDMAVAAQYLLDRKKAKKILIADLDVHQGNGTASIFAQDPQVFTFSMHSGKNYPLRKERSDLDISLDLYTGDAEYLRILRKYLPYVIDSLKPDFIFFQSGVDILEYDELGKLKVTINGCRERDIFIFETANRLGIPVATSMGGGYSKQLRHIVDAHCNTYRVAKDIYG